jgi:hypothetical protein
MKIHQTTVSAGPSGVRPPGVHDLPPEEALALVAGGFARLLEQPAVETASAEPAKEVRASIPPTSINANLEAFKAGMITANEIRAIEGEPPPPAAAAKKPRKSK